MIERFKGMVRRATCRHEYEAAGRFKIMNPSQWIIIHQCPHCEKKVSERV